MQLAIDPLDVPRASAGYEDDVASKLGHSWEHTGIEQLEAAFEAQWSFSRKASAEAARLALEATPGSPLAVTAARLAKRHAGVWKGAKLLMRNDGIGGRERSAVAVRADAGDLSCSGWIARESYNRCKRLKPIIQAARYAGLFIAKASTGPLDRLTAKRFTEEITSPITRNALSAEGLDVHTVPVVGSPDKVTVHLLGAFSVCPSIIHSPLSNIILEFTDASFTWEETFGLLLQACNAYGAADWIRLHIGNLTSGLRLRSRITCGIFYGKNAKQLVAQGAAFEQSSLVKKQSVEVDFTEVHIENALAIAHEAAEAGDLNVAVRAARFAACYAEDMNAKLESYHSVLQQHLTWSAEMDLTGLSDSPVLPDTHTDLLAKLSRLPMPLDRIAHEGWECVGFKAIRCAKDLSDVVKWVKKLVDVC